MKKSVVYCLLPVVCCLLSVVCLACSRGLMTHEAAREAAVQYYTMLMEGDYEGYVDGMAFISERPESFRSQMIDVVKMTATESFLKDLQAVTVLSDSLGEDSTAYVRLELNFGDSIGEEIEQALILTEEGWKMQ